MPTFDSGGGVAGETGTGGIIVRYTATGAEGTSFLVPIGQTLASADYVVTQANQGVTNVALCDFPEAVGDRTTTYFRCNVVMALTAGDKLVFVLFMES
jgi:hypothetical protein